MAKQKKKQSRQSRDKVTEAHRRNQFLYKVNYLITALTGDPSLYKMLPQIEHKKLFLLRMRAPRVIEAPGVTLPKAIFAELKEHLIWFLKTNTIPFTADGPLVTLDLYLTIGLTLYTYLRILEDNAFAGAIRLKKALSKLLEHNEEGEYEVILKEPHAMCKDAFTVLSMVLNDFRRLIYWIDLELAPPEKGILLGYYKFQINMYRPELRHVKVENNARPAYEVCWGYCNEGLIKLAINPTQLGLPPDAYPESLPVYIQTHALNRLYERIDCAKEYMIPFGIRESLFTCNYIKDAHQKYLLDFLLLTKKVGYLVASIQQGVVLIHTFLLITSNGTPEGDRLAVLTKLKKLDKEYLTIDKLSAFYASDISDNPEVKQLFLDAGCTDLFDLEPNIISDETRDQKKPLADKIRAYLNISNMAGDEETYKKEQMPV